MSERARPLTSLDTLLSADRLILLAGSLLFATLVCATPGHPDDGTGEVGVRREIKTTIFSDSGNEYPIDLADPAKSEAVRDRIRKLVRERTALSLANFVKGFDVDELKATMARHKDGGSAIPADVTAFIGSVDTIELDDGFAKDTKAVDAAKKLFVFKTLVSFDLPPEEAAPAKAARVGSEEKLLPGETEDVERANLIRLYEKTHPRQYRFEIDQAKVIKEDPNDYVENMKHLKEIAAKGGLPNSVTSRKWIEGQADCVDENGNPKPGVWVHTHADGTIRDFPQESYEVPPLASGKALAATEYDALDVKTPMDQYRDLVSHAEQKVLYVDYEHYPEGMTPTRDAAIDVNKVGAPGTQVITDSDHPYGNTKDGTGSWDKKIIRAVYWRDIAIPIVMIDRADGARTMVADQILLWEKMVDLWDTPPDRIPYMIPPLLEPPEPPTTYTRNQFPLRPTYGGR